MGEYIKKEDAIRVVKKYFTGWLELNPDICLDGIRSLPAADVVERKKGKWKEYDFPVLGKRKHCSACGFIKAGSDERIYNFCPRCGADCRKEEI